MPELQIRVVPNDYSGGQCAKKANMSTVAIVVAFIFFKNKVPDEI